MPTSLSKSNLRRGPSKHRDRSRQQVTQSSSIAAKSHNVQGRERTSEDTTLRTSDGRYKIQEADTGSLRLAYNDHVASNRFVALSLTEPTPVAATKYRSQLTQSNFTFRVEAPYNDAISSEDPPGSRKRASRSTKARQSLLALSLHSPPESYESPMSNADERIEAMVRDFDVFLSNATGRSTSLTEPSQLVIGEVVEEMPSKTSSASPSSDNMIQRLPDMARNPDIQGSPSQVASPSILPFTTDLPPTQRRKASLFRSKVQLPQTHALTSSPELLPDVSSASVGDLTPPMDPVNERKVALFVVESIPAERRVQDMVNQTERESIVTKTTSSDWSAQIDHDPTGMISPNETEPMTIASVRDKYEEVVGEEYGGGHGENRNPVSGVENDGDEDWEWIGQE